MKTRSLKESFLRITQQRRVRSEEIRNFKRQFKDKLLEKTKNFGPELMEHAPENRGTLISGEFAEFISFANALKSLKKRRIFLSLLVETIWDYESATDEHQRRVSYGCRKVAYAMGGRIDHKNLKLAARFHDLGKISWPKEFLVKKGPLSTGEMQLIEAHLYLGFHFFEHIGFTEKASRILWYNHVHDGYPYFENLRDVPIEGQILSAVDVFDAMTSPRFYRENPKYTQEEAFEELRQRPYHPVVLETIRRELILSGTWDELGL